MAGDITEGLKANASTHIIPFQSKRSVQQIPLVDLRAQYFSIRKEIDEAIARVVSSSRFILGEEVEAFESAFADFVRAKESVGVASGTAALRLALQAVGVGPGDRVITTAHSFFATAEAISQLGAVPVFVDVLPNTLTIDPNRIEEALRSSPGRVAAIVPVHIYGQPADMPSINEIGQRHGVPVIEDAAQAHGAEIDGRRCGTIGDLACFSFFPSKNLGAFGDAGAITGNDPDLLTRVRRLRNHGRTTKYEHEEVGWGERLDALQAAILRAKLPHLEQWIELRRDHAQLYNEMLSDLRLVTPYAEPRSRHVYHLYVVRVEDRDRVQEKMREMGVATGIHYPIPLHRQPAYVNSLPEKQLPNVEAAADEVLSLPLYPELTREQMSFVASALRSVLESV